MSSPTNKKGDQSLNVIDLVLFFVSRWKWFVLSILVCGSLAYLKYAVSPLEYYSAATVIIKDPSNKTTTAGLDRFDNYINRVNVANEILQFHSKRLMREVVERTHADVSYRIRQGLRPVELFNQAPVAVSFADSLPGLSAEFKVQILDSGTVKLLAGDDDGKEDRPDAFTVKMGQTTDTPYGKLLIAPTNYFGSHWEESTITVRKMPVDEVVRHYVGAISIRQEEDESSILTLSLRDESASRATDILNMLITVYNEDAIRDKNHVAVSTADFINDRLIIIGRELGEVEADLESFKKTNQMIDIESSATMFMSESQRYNSNALELETQMRLANYIRDYLTDPKKEVDLIPSNTGISDMKIEGQIMQYNALKLRRDKLIDDSSDRNPVVEELNNNLRALKQNIIRAVDNMIVSIDVKRKDAYSHEQRAQSRVASIPTKERQMISIERQQKIKEALYMFLLNRREENALSQAMADNNARVIDSAEATPYPIAPNKRRILLLGLLMGVAIPGVVFVLYMFMDTRVHGRKDIEGSVTIPYLGEIPVLKKDDANSEAVEEAFRILRTNMQFMNRNKERPLQVITFTSFNEGAGKTFISRNLSRSLVAAKKRVVVVDLDLRTGTFSRAHNAHRTGVTDYLADNSLTVEDVIQHHEESYDIVSAGTVAPNPAELLLDHRLDELIDELRTRYDYVIVDNVPVGIIADSTIANRVADLTLFVARAGHFDRRQLDDVEQLYQERKLGNMAMVLNGADMHHRYGYRYYGYYGHYGRYHYYKSKKQTT